jgi:hypothetical protein
MSRWGLAAIAVLAAAALFIAAEAQQGHTERISGEGPSLLIGTPCQFLQLELIDFYKAVLCPSSWKGAKAIIFWYLTVWNFPCLIWLWLHFAFLNHRSWFRLYANDLYSSY